MGVPGAPKKKQTDNNNPMDATQIPPWLQEELDDEVIPMAKPGVPAGNSTIVVKWFGGWWLRGGGGGETDFINLYFCAKMTPKIAISKELRLQ